MKVIKFFFIILWRLFGDNKEKYENWEFLQLISGKDYQFTPYIIVILFLLMFLITSYVK